MKSTSRRGYTTAGLLVLGLLLGSIAVSAQERGGGRDGITPIPHRPLSVRPDRGEGAWYRIGDPVSLRLDIPFDGYLTVYDVTPSGRIQVIFPHAWDRGCYVRAGRMSLPDAGDSWSYQIGGPSGTECVVAVLSRTRYQPPIWLPQERLSASGSGDAPEKVTARRKAETDELNRRIVCGPPTGPRPTPPPPYAVSSTWLRVR